ncbi:MAG: rhamnan synthesis F family protein [Verrucomicrobia bacterium]|nr:rhamnan synthesis F family protein [Verrucomicrobiota bacterium]
MLAKVLHPDYVGRLWLENRHDWARRYMEAWRAGLELRKPFPGFHPGIYRDHHPEVRGDPTIDFLKAGRPEGPWLTEVMREGGAEWLKVKSDCDREYIAVGTAWIDPATAGPQRGELSGRERVKGNKEPIQAALHLHLHYPEQADVLIRALGTARQKPDLFISLTSKEGKVSVKGLLEKYRVKCREIAVFPNRGRDLGPFLTGFRESLLNYEIVGHFHTKGSKHAPPDFVKRWNAFLSGNLIGLCGQMMDTILDRMAADSGIGIVYPDDPMIWGWFENYTIGKTLLEKLGLAIPNENTFFNYPAGSMFWARTAALKPLFDLGLRWEDYPEEPISQDGSILHAIERLFGIIPEQIGYRTLLTHVSGLIR